MDTLVKRHREALFLAQILDEHKQLSLQPQVNISRARIEHQMPERFTTLALQPWINRKLHDGQPALFSVRDAQLATLAPPLFSTGLLVGDQLPGMPHDLPPGRQPVSQRCSRVASRPTTVQTPPPRRADLLIGAFCLIVGASGLLVSSLTSCGLIFSGVGVSMSVLSAAAGMVSGLLALYGIGRLQRYARQSGAMANDYPGLYHRATQPVGIALSPYVSAIRAIPR